MEEALKENRKGNTKNSQNRKEPKRRRDEVKRESILTVLYSFQDSKGEDEASAPQHFEKQVFMHVAPELLFPNTWTSPSHTGKHSMSDESQASQEEEMLKQTEFRNAVQKIIHVTDCNLSHQTKTFTSKKQILLYPILTQGL